MICRECGEEYGPGYSVRESDRPGVCFSCAEAIADAGPEPAPFYYVGQALEGVDISVLRGGEPAGDYGTVRVREYYGREDGLQRLSVVDDVYGREYDVTNAELAEAAAA